MKKKIKVFFAEFKKFVSKGNVLDLAVAVIIGTAFSKIITSVVEDMLMPLIGVILGGIHFSGLHFRVGNAIIQYGSFLQSIINFIIIALCLFIIVKAANKLVKKEEKPSIPTPNKQEKLLTEIRDILKKQSKK